MEIDVNAPLSLKAARETLLDFVRAYGETRITRKALLWLKSADDETMHAEEGDRLLVARAGQQLLGICGAQQFGREVCFVVVRPEWRGRGIGRLLLTRMKEDLGQLTCRVAYDNAGSMAMCRGAGLLPAQVVNGPTGKISLVWTSAPTVTVPSNPAPYLENNGG